MNQPIDMTDVINPMTKTEAEEWCAALESGEYKQGHGKLKDADGNYCCLGVEREVHPEQCKPVNYEGTLYADIIADGASEQRSVRLPETVQGVLWKKNDGVGLDGGSPAVPFLPFPEIAAYIRSNIIPGLPD